MERKELIRQLRSVKLDNGNPIQWVHLICEAAEMLEKDEAQSCVGCAYEETPQRQGKYWCQICSRSHKDRYKPRMLSEDSEEKKPDYIPSRE